MWKSLIFLLSPLANAQPNLISITSGLQKSVGSDVMLSTFSVAQDQLRASYPRLFANSSWISRFWKNESCSMDTNEATVDILLELYNRRLLQKPHTVIFAPQVDAVTIQCTSGDNSQTDRSRYATNVPLIAIDNAVHSEALLALLNQFGWKNVAVIHDKLSHNDYYARNNEICRNLLTTFQKDRSKFNHLLIETDSSISPDWKNVLWAAGNHSRIILACTLGVQQNELLVFLFDYAVQVPLDPPLLWNQSGLTDPRLVSGYENVFLLSTQPVDWSTKKKVTRSVRVRHQELFGEALDEDYEYNEFVINCYHSTQATAQIFDELYQKYSEWTAIPSGKALAEHFLGRSFFWDEREITIGEDGKRVFRVDVRQFSRSANSFENVFTYTQGSRKLQPTGKAIEWKLGVPPPDLPHCGIDGYQCDDTSNFPGIAIGLTSVFVLLLVCVWKQLMWRQSESDLQSSWWRVPLSAIKKACYICDDRLANPSLVSARIAGTGAYHSSIFHLGGNRKVLLGSQMTYLRDFGFPFPEFLVNDRRFLKLLREIKDLNRDHFNPFVGICHDRKPAAIFHKYCPKGSMDDLLRDTYLHWDLKFSLMLDLIRGLCVLHSSSLQFHGNLKSSKCLIDDHFSLRISDVAYEKIKLITTQFGSWVPSPSHNLWMSPERLNGVKANASCDIYAFSIICHQIIEDCPPFNLDSIKRSDIKRALEELKFSSGKTLEPEFSKCIPYQFAGQLVILLRKCWNRNPLARPLAGEILQEFKKFAMIGGYSGSLFDMMVRRVQLYTLALESEVQERTLQICEEKARCDQILGQILPKNVIHTLRSGKYFRPKIFEEVSVLFADLSGGLLVREKENPFCLLGILHKFYLVVDDVLARFRIYRVTAVADCHMVVSGLPFDGVANHTDELCYFALQLLKCFDACMTFEGLRLRIGIDCGPVAGGVVGIKLPRYCLFGSTVSMANLMLTTGQPSYIHVSAKTVGQVKDPFLTFHKRQISPRKLVTGEKEPVTYWLLDSKLDIGLKLQEQIDKV